ncbi:MAG: regulatory protein RecX, partial [Candidatus Omnitrophica bacterium]|nr:regulatory protein RecX [Candidatus Omnitrophota bacterium]
MEKNPADFDVRSADSPKNEALNYALRVLSASPKSRHQLKEKMLTKGFAESLTESVLGRLEAAGYINDQALAEGLVHRMASSRKGYGKRRAAFELKRRGFGPDTAERALEGLSPSQEEEAALSLARLVWEKSAKLPEPK